MSAQESKALFRRYIEEVFNKRNVAAIDEILSPEFVHHFLPPGVTPNRDGMKQFVPLLLAAFGEFHLTIEDMVAEGDRVAARLTMGGIHQGQFIGIAPTGKRITWTEIGIHRVEGGRVAESWVEVDQLGMMRQMGVLPRRSDED